MSLKDELGKRMKENYEAVTKYKLTRRMPVAIRIDGKAFHTFTRGFEHPFDNLLISTMQQTMKSLCENIQGCVLGYTQSDEITLILVDYNTLVSNAWFDNEVQKICSISASMATLEFNKIFSKLVFEEQNRIQCNNLPIYDNKVDGLTYCHKHASKKGAMFDSRCFNIPKEEVTNLIYWRQLDATRNSIEMAGRAYYSHKELDHKNQSDIQEMLHQKGINWNDYPVPCKRGSCCIKQKYFVDENGTEYTESALEIDDPLEFKEFTKGKTLRSRWVIDKNIPVFKGKDRNYIDKLIYVGEE